MLGVKIWRRRRHDELQNGPMPSKIPGMQNLSEKKGPEEKLSCEVIRLKFQLDFFIHIELLVSPCHFSIKDLFSPESKKIMRNTTCIYFFPLYWKKLKA